MTTLYETDKLILQCEDETTSLKDKVTGKILFEDCHYGNSQCGLIDECNNWAIIAGEHLSIWTPRKTHKMIQKGLAWVHDIRIKKTDTVEILVDPWSKYSSIWELNLINFEIHKIRDFNDYRNCEYTEKVIW